VLSDANLARSFSEIPVNCVIRCSYQNRILTIGCFGLVLARTVLSDPSMRHEYDMHGNYGLQDYNYTVSNDIALVCFLFFLGQKF
jgi:hypothetical protein